MFTTPPATIIAAVRRAVTRSRGRRHPFRALVGTALVLLTALTMVGAGLGILLAGGSLPLAGVDVDVPECPAPPPAPAGSLRVELPMAPGSYRLTSGFGGRNNPITGQAEGHRGQDFGAPAGTPILAAAAGRVIRAGPASGFGMWIVIEHDIAGERVDTVYGHMWPAGVGVTEGEVVSAGQRIGSVGSNGQSTGPHLHFEVWEGGRFDGGRAVNPEPLLAAPVPSPPSPPPAPPVAPPEVLSLESLMPVGPEGSQREMTLSDEQRRNAEVIVAVGKERGLPPRAWVIAIATALQESTLVNLDYGDRDSVGLFQQRTSQGWGTVDQIMDPRYSAGKFYEVLENKVVDVDPGWERRPLTRSAQIVQRSGFPQAYAKWETVAAEAVLAVQGVGPVTPPQASAVGSSCVATV